jgi:uncharacterized small protein (DUF1192 family)
VDKQSNVVSLAWKREERQREQIKKQIRDGRNSSLEQRIALLENELDRVIAILLDTNKLAEENRDYLIKMARLLQNKPNK